MFHSFFLSVMEIASASSFGVLGSTKWSRSLLYLLYSLGPLEAFGILLPSIVSSRISCSLDLWLACSPFRCRKWLFLSSLVTPMLSGQYVGTLKVSVPFLVVKKGFGNHCRGKLRNCMHNMSISLHLLPQKLLAQHHSF